jgi:hypothetical protein
MQTWGGELRKLEALQRQGVRVKALDTRPRLMPADAFGWDLFSALSNSRPVGMSVGAIQVSEFLSACALYGVRACDRVWWWGVIRQVDAAYLEARRNANSPADN